ncbi:TPA: hypothetical protein ACNBKL_003839 [Escherichia coli]|uniref:Uncharacterized protein n=1 Tax=Proteus phage 7 TaxID=2767546 RepID=A0A7G9UTZ4_9CAUD|nr:hypothetical protein [Salmonella enterica subsp. enterica serovar Virchow]EBY3806609.1 hypothetical protein [Salmonella enterica subsp. enterica serovar Adabraka]ECB7586760.1 hypothetical protein [Salmonella enterica subsp. enterica serovar Oranienburg]ECO0128449.1 hypothetical protein [Salmonella enterica subsp. enterica serovar Enteritidis]QNN97499.1 hypothetical protein [Proteus phage 7]WFG41656.1 hypothetical protein LFCCKGHI_00132 [Salmonella phage MET_P1_082_240]
MDIVLEKSKLSAPMFDGAGFMVRAHRDMSWATSFGGDADVPVDLYMSRDAVEAVLQWVRMWELHLRGDETVKTVSEILTINDIKFVLYPMSDYAYTRLKDMDPIQAAKIFDTVRQNFTTGFAEREPLWECKTHPLGGYVAESYNVPGRFMQFSYENDTVRYNYQYMNCPAPVPYVSDDLTMVRIAESLLSVADTQTYPRSGYVLELKLGFGELKLGDLNRDQLREIAQRLIP